MPEYGIRVLTRRISAATPKTSKPKANGTDALPGTGLPSDPEPPLAGVSKVVDSAVSYLRRAALSGSAKPLLITGSKGSGKTVIAKAIGAVLEADRNILSGELWIYVLN